MTTAAELLCDRKWRLKNSLWMLPVVACMGSLTWAAFLYIGIRARNRIWLALATGFFVTAAVSFTLSTLYSDGAKETTNGGENASGALLVLAWIGGIIAMLIVRRGWLRWLADHEANNAGPWYGSASSPVPSSGMRPAPTDVLDEAVRGASPATQVPPANDQRELAALDLNAATQAELLAVLGLGQAMTDQIIAARDRLGRFSSADQLMTEASLPPHVFVGIRDRVVLGTPNDRRTAGSQGPDDSLADRRTSGGRRLEL